MSSQTMPPLKSSFVHSSIDHSPSATQGVKMSKGIVYKYASSNNIDRGNNTQLPFLYQAPSVRQGTPVARAHPTAGIVPNGDDSHSHSHHLDHSAIPRKRSTRKKRESTKLPKIPNLPPSSSNVDFDVSLTLAGKSIQLNTKSGTTSESSVGSTAHRRVRLSDSLSKKEEGIVTEYGYVGRPNGIIVKQQDAYRLPSLSITLPPRAKSAHDLSDSTRRRSIDRLHLKEDISSISTQSLHRTAEQATQTVMYHAIASVEYLGKIKATQTEAVPYYHRRKSELAADRHNQEREALLEVIDDALEETIDRYSRERTNQIIAKSARKQAEIWRDAKDFIANFLLPQSVALANKSRRRRQTAAEIVGNIKIYP